MYHNRSFEYSYAYMELNGSTIIIYEETNLETYKMHRTKCIVMVISFIPFVL